MSYEVIQAYRVNTFRLSPALRIQNQEQAIEFCNQRGFIYFWPISGIIMPSLWAAVAGDRPVADQHDDPGHITWGWKDGLLGGQAWYYAKVLRKKATMISFQLAPYFYALSENYGSPEDDYLTIYEQGRMTKEARDVYETLLKQGPLDTVALRRATRLTSKASDSSFNRAMTDLQADFKILPVAVTQSGGWHYAFAYDLVARHYPELPRQAESIRESAAKEKLLEAYIRSVGAATAPQARKLFGWRLPSIERAFDNLANAGVVVRNVSFQDQPGEWNVLSQLVGT